MLHRGGFCDGVGDPVHGGQKVVFVHRCCGQIFCHCITPHAIINGMKLSIDHSGRIVIPKPMRKRLGLTSGTELEVVEQSGGVFLRPVMQRPSLIKVDGVWVHQGTAEPGADWERLADDVREERIQDLLKVR